jgi:integrase
MAMMLAVQDAAPGPALPENAGARPARRLPAPETARAYAMDWQAFVAWCQAAERTALPAAPATVAAFLVAAAETLSAGALGRRAAAISDRHRQAGFPPPTADPAVRAILRAARRTATPKRPPPRRPSQLVRMAAACPGDLAGLRDRALLLLAGDGLGRSALVGLDVEHLRFTAASVELTMRAAAAGDDTVRRISVPRGATLATCPVQALADWLRSSDTQFGPVFRKVDRWGTIEPSRLGTDALRRILARRTPRRARRTRTAVA